MSQDTEALKKVIKDLKGPLSSEQTADLRRRLESLVAEREAEIDFKAVTDSLSDGIFLTDKANVIRYINPAYSEYTGLKPEEVIGKTSEELVEEGVFKRVATPEVIKTKRTQILLGYVRTVDDRDLYGYCIVRPVLNGDGEVRYAVVTLYDPERLKGRYSEFSRGNDAVELPIRVREGVSEDAPEPAVGSSQGLKNAYAIAKRVAATDATVLIFGESGVGKEGVADYICANSPRRNKPFVKVNCTAIPANLLESELFGYEKGAFTGAGARGQAGLFERAQGGTILLDEIGDLSIDLQAKLLRVIQQKELMRIGGTNLIKLDLRIVSSTNADLRKKIEEDKFREDLYYRLATIPIHVPPLRERREDIPDLINYYLEFFGRHHHRHIEISDEHMRVFEGYDWPGNIRELRNVVEYLVVCADENYLSNINALLRMLGVDGYSRDTQGLLPTLEESMNSYEKGRIMQAVRKTGGVRKAAVVLGVDPATVSRKMKKHNISLSEKS
jgi:PAS domain S-box-containing protein